MQSKNYIVAKSKYIIPKFLLLNTLVPQDESTAHRADNN